MPSSRRLRVTAVIAILTVLIIVYVTNGAKSTHNSQFYTRTVEAIKHRQEAEARKDVIAEEQQRLERVRVLQKEHEAALSKAAAQETASAAPVAAGGSAKQAPLAHDVKDAASRAAGAVKEEFGEVKPVAGRKTMQVGEKGKVVQTRPATAKEDDGVARVGNVEAKPSPAKTADREPETEEEHKVESELNDILKKGPIIIFSKTYCPFSKKAKHILLDLYTITPKPYVVELDQHALGPGLQKALTKSTGRGTVPNVLINGKSIGGGDDVEALHREQKLAETVASMGGKRVVSIVENEPPTADEKAEVKFKA